MPPRETAAPALPARETATQPGMLPDGAGFLAALEPVVARYLAQDAEAGEHLSLLRWQITEGHPLEHRTTYPVISPPARSSSRRISRRPC